MTGEKDDCLRKSVFDLVHLFHCRMERMLKQHQSSRVYLLPSTSPIQALIVPGNKLCTQFCTSLFEVSGGQIRIFPIKSPTVPAGQERVRIILHANNTRQEVELLVGLIATVLLDMNLLLLPRATL